MDSQFLSDNKIIDYSLLLGISENKEAIIES